MENENKIATNDLETNIDTPNPDLKTDADSPRPDLENKDGASGQDFQQMIDSVFNQNNLTMVGWFLGVYLVVYLGLGIFYKKEGEESTFKQSAKKIVDFLFVILLIFMIITFVYLLSKDQQDEYSQELYNSVLKFLDNPYSLLPGIAILIAFYVMVYLFKIPMDGNKPFSVAFIEGLLWITLVIVVLVQFFKQVFNLSLLNFFDELKEETEEKIKEETTELEVQQPEEEVFHISNNKYNYEDAKAICKAYDSELATYKQVENSYQKGGEWCGYGWSQDQMALFPTQQTTYDKLKSNGKEVQYNCGRPGINGGHIANPYIKFGVNCFGKKPKAGDDDMARMAISGDNLPMTAEQKELQAKTQYWKDNASKLLQITSFNKDKWSRNDQ